METPQTRGQIQNPYTAGTRAEYKQGKIEQFLHDSLGFRTGIDQYNENMDNLAAQWDTQNQSLAYEENYNSAAEQTARMREAGLNPDINGDVNAGIASEMAEPETSPETPEGIDVQMLQKRFEFKAQIAALALDMATGAAGVFSTITNAAIQKGNAEIDQGQKLRTLANEAYGELEPHLKANALPGENDFWAKTLGNAGGFLAKMNGLSGKNAKKFKAMYNGMVNSATAKFKTLEKQGKLIEAEANPAIQLPGVYADVQAAMLKASAIDYDIELEKSQRELEVLKNNPELFKGMTTAMMRQKISEAVLTNNQAEIAKYDKAIKELDKIDREYEQKQLTADREYIRQFQKGDISKNITNYIHYQNALKRIYGRNTDVLAGAAGDVAKIGLGAAGGGVAGALAAGTLGQGKRTVVKGF